MGLVGAVEIMKIALNGQTEEGRPTMRIVCLPFFVYPFIAIFLIHKSVSHS